MRGWGERLLSRQCGESSLGLLFECEGFGVLFAQAVDDVCGGAGDEAFVAKLLIGGIEALVVFGEVFGKALALDGDIDLACIDY